MVCWGLCLTVLLPVCVHAIPSGKAQGDVALSMQHALGFRRYTTQDGLPQMQCEVAWQDTRGYIYVGTLSGFVRYDGRTFTPFLRGRRVNIVGFAQPEGQVRALGFGRQWSLEDDVLTQMPIDHHGNYMLNNFNAVDLPTDFVLIEDRNEENRRLCQLTGNGLDTLIATPLLDELTPDRKLLLDDNHLYLPTPKGLYRCEWPLGSAAWLVQEGATHEELLSDKPDFYSLCRVGDVLYALAADGIYILTPQPRKLKDALWAQTADYGISARATQSGLLIMADSHSLYTFDGDSIREIASGFNLIKGLLIDRWDRLWVSTYQGLYCYFNRHFMNHWLTDSKDIVRSLAIDGKGRLVTGTLNGKLLVDDHIVSDDANEFFMPSSAVIDGNVYMAGRHDIVCIADGTCRWLGLNYDRCQFIAEADGHIIIGVRHGVLSYQPDDGHLDTLSTEVAHPWCATTDGKGGLWVGSTYGLYHIKDGKTVKTDEEGPNLTVTAMDGDEKGHVFLASNDSLFMIREGEKPVCMNKEMPQLQGHEIRSLHVSPRGFLVIAVIDGLLVCHIDEQGHISGSSFYDHHNGFTMIEPLKATMAEEADGTVWLAGVEDMTSFKPEELLADNNADTYIAPPLTWWQRWWWLAALVGLAGVILLVVAEERMRHRSKLRRLQRAKKQKELQINAIRLKAIPHFHSNVLAGIEFFLMNNSVEEAMHYLKLYSDFTNQTLTDIDRASRTVTE